MIKVSNEETAASGRVRTVAMVLGRFTSSGVVGTDI